MSLHSWVENVTTIVTIASIVANLLPKDTVFDDYPAIKKVYGTVINFIAVLAFNIRRRLPSMDIPMLGFSEEKDSKVIPQKVVSIEANKDK